jgi:hypothetical protein
MSEEEFDAPDRDDYWHEEEDVLIAEVTHDCCGRSQSYWNCSSEDVPGPEATCRDCRPRVEPSDADFVDPFGEE